VSGNESSALIEETKRHWLRQILSLVVGIVFLVVSGVILVDRIASVIDNPIELSGHGTSAVQLSTSTQTIYVGCNDDIQCSPLSVDNIHVVDSTNHVKVPIIPDLGIDHESFHEHPWLSVASFAAAKRGRYLITIDDTRNGEYALLLAQVEFLHVIAPLVLTTVLRLVGVGLGIAALLDLARVGRRRSRGQTSAQ
jgi:hypothetical protein